MHIWKSHVRHKLDVQEASVSFTQSEIISVDAGLHLDGIPVLDLLDLIIEVLPSSFDQPEMSKEKVQGDLLRRHHTDQENTKGGPERAVRGDSNSARPT